MQSPEAHVEDDQDDILIHQEDEDFGKLTTTMGPTSSKFFSSSWHSPSENNDDLVSIVLQQENVIQSIIKEQVDLKLQDSESNFIALKNIVQSNFDALSEMKEKIKSEVMNEIKNQTIKDKIVEEKSDAKKNETIPFMKQQNLDDNEDDLSLESNIIADGESRNTTHQSSARSLHSTNSITNRGLFFARQDYGEERALPTDIYTLLFLMEIRSTAFAYGFFIFFIQAYVLFLIPWNTLYDENIPQHLKFDNVKQPDISIAEILKIPETTTLSTIMSQIVAFMLCIISTNSDFTDAITLLDLRNEGIIRFDFPAATRCKGWMAFMMRFYIALCVLIVTFLLIVQSSTPIDILINFAAVIFVSELDNLGYEVACRGWLGHEMTQLTKKIVNIECKDRSEVAPMGMLIIFLVMTAAYVPITIAQWNGYVLKGTVCDRLSVSFGDDVYYLPNNEIRFNVEQILDEDCNEGDWNCNYTAIEGSWRRMDFESGYAPNIYFSYFSGVYVGELDDSFRLAYWERGETNQKTSGLFYYCEYERAWVFTIQAFMDNGVISSQTIGDKKEGCKYGWFMRSPITDATGLDQVPMDGWTLWTQETASSVSSLSITCAECQSDHDCGPEGLCTEENSCTCNEGKTGHFCTEKAPCEFVKQLYATKTEHTYPKLFWTNYHLAVYSHFNNLMAYDRPVYHGLKLETNVLLIYIGSRWMQINFVPYPYTSLEEFIDMYFYAGANNFYAGANNFHAYWNDVLGEARTTDISVIDYIYRSVSTEEYSPIGNLDWVYKERTNSFGNFGDFGFHHFVGDYQRYECYSVDCRIQKICGENDNAFCNSEAMLPIPNGTEIKGGQCECTSGNVFGFFCEIPCSSFPKNPSRACSRNFIIGDYEGNNDCSDCDVGCAVVNLTLTTDQYPGETSFVLKNNQTDAILWDVERLDEPDAMTYFTSNVCPTNCYSFTIRDYFGDGICCSKGEGEYTLNFQGETVTSGGNFSYFSATFFGDGCSNQPFNRFPN